MKQMLGIAAAIAVSCVGCHHVSERQSGPGRDATFPEADDAARVSFEFNGTDIRDAISQIARKARVNIAVSKPVSGTITVHLRDIPWPKALAAVVALVDAIAIQEVSGLVRVITPREWKAER